jgi:hypothetical protein
VEREARRHAQATKKREPHPVEVVLRHQVVGPDRLEAGAVEQPMESARREVSAVTGQVQVEPLWTGEPRLQRTKVWHRHEKDTARHEPIVHTLQRGLGVGHVLEHVPQQDRVEPACGVRLDRRPSDAWPAR